MKDLHIYGLKHDMRLKSYDEDRMYDIKDFEIIDHKNNKFIPVDGEVDFCIKDAQYFIIYGNVFEDIIKNLAEEHYQRGLRDGRKPKKEKEVTE